MNRLRTRGGFTLLEMMIAMGILAVSYVALMQAASMSMRLSTFGKQITLATFLAQGKMEQVEETLTKEGFPDMDDSEEGDFEEQGHPAFKWKLEINKVELPLAEAFGQLMGNMGGGDDEEGGGALGGLGGGMGDLESKLGGQLGDQLKGQLGGVMGGSGGSGGGIAGMLNPQMLAGQVEQLATMLEQALREVRLTVYWEEGGPGKELVLTTHLVQVPSAGAGGLPGGAGTPGAGDVASQLGQGKAGAGSALQNRVSPGGPSGPGGTASGAGRKSISPGLK